MSGALSGMTVKLQVLAVDRKLAVLASFSIWVAPPRLGRIGCGRFRCAAFWASADLTSCGRNDQRFAGAILVKSVSAVVAPPLVTRTVSSLNCGMRRGSLLLAVCDCPRGRQEDRRAASIGGRCHPGIDAHIRLRFNLLRRVKGIGDQAGTVRIGIGESDTGDQHGKRAQARNGRCGQYRAAEDPFPVPRSSAPCASGVRPQGQAEGTAGGRLVVLNADRLVRKVVALLEHPVRVGIVGNA